MSGATCVMGKSYQPNMSTPLCLDAASLLRVAMVTTNTRTLRSAAHASSDDHHLTVWIRDRLQPFLPTRESARGLRSDGRTPSSSEVITDCQEGHQRQAVSDLFCHRAHCVSFRETKTGRTTFLRSLSGAFTNDDWDPPTDSVVSLTTNRCFTAEMQGRSRYTVVETHKLFHMELPERHFPHQPVST